MRIDVADPGSERLAIVAALVSAGFDVRAIEIRDVPETRADLVVLAGDARDALEALRTLRDDGARPDVPVVLVGTPEGTDPIASGPGFGAERVLGRPVDEETLIEAVRLLIRPHPSEVSMVERVPELTLELAQRERAGTWRTAAGEERDDPSGVSAIHPMSDHEPASAAEERATPDRPSTPPGTTSSGRGERPSRTPSVPPPPTGVSVVERRDRASEMPPATSTPGFSSAAFSTTGTGPGGTGSDIVPVAAISDTLRSLLAQADRRVFPSLAVIDVSIPAGEASALELVPDEFLDDAPFIDPEPEEETLFLPAMPPSGWAAAGGTPSAVTPSAASGHAESPYGEPRASSDARREAADEPAKKTAPGTPASMPSRPPRPAATVLTAGSVADARSVSRRGELPATLPDDSSLGAPAADGARHLRLTAGAMLRALLSLVLHRGTTRVEVRSPRATEPDVILGFAHGELISIEGPLHQEALELGRAGAGLPVVSPLVVQPLVVQPLVVQPLVVQPLGREASDEQSAKERLVSLIERREMSLATSAFFFAMAERTLLTRVIAMVDGEARFRPAADRDAPPRLGRTGPLLLVLSRSLEPAVLTNLAGKGAHLAPSRSFASVCEVLEPPREVVALFERDGATTVDLARASLAMPGLVGMAAALLAAGGLTALSREDDGGIDARAAEALVIEHARRAEDADYFTLLGVPRDATDAAIRDAREGRVAMLAALPLDALGLGALAPSCRTAIDAVEEAASALASPRLRAAYAQALAAPSVLAPSASPNRPG